ncbi:MAG: maltose ABC transporter substrate-binding protein, partial [Dorea sp.]|nr:maltose ABC transporter substrate-binding protein [Dorea sp.]
MRKRMCGLFLGMLCTAVFTGCSLSEKAELEDTSKKKVEMVVWGAEEDTELMNQIIQSFISNHQGEADFQISFEVQGESQ